MEIKKVQEIIYKFQKGRRFSGRDLLKDNSIFSKIKSKQDIQRSKVIVQNHINTYNDKSFDVGHEEISDLKNVIGEFEIAISKAIQLHEHTGEFTDEELVELINKLGSFYDEFEKIRKRKTFR